MRILVVDDKEKHLRAARAQLKYHDRAAMGTAQLKCHDLTVVGTYEEAQTLLGGGVLGSEMSGKHDFEVVLVDLHMPPMGWPGAQEMPIGIFLAILAAKNGAKYVAVFTDQNHHANAASACFDAINRSPEPAPFMIEGAKVILSNAISWIKDFEVDGIYLDFDDIANKELT